MLFEFSFLESRRNRAFEKIENTFFVFLFVRRENMIAIEKNRILRIIVEHLTRDIIIRRVEADDVQYALQNSKSFSMIFSDIIFQLFFFKRAMNSTKAIDMNVDDTLQRVLNNSFHLRDD